MKRSVYSIVFITAISFQTNATAKTFNYSRISIGYMNQTVQMDGISNDLKANGYELSASFDVNRSFGVQLSLGKGSGDVKILGSKVNLDADTKMLGMFFHAPISSNVDVVLGAALLQGELKASIGNTTIATDNTDGQTISVGVRMMASDRIEINAGVDRTFTGRSSDSSIMVGAFGYLSKGVNLGVSYSSNNNSQATFFSVSKYF